MSTGDLLTDTVIISGADYSNSIKVPTYDEVLAKSKKNWAKVSVLHRYRCVEHLRKHAPPKVIAEWVQDYREGDRIGKSDAMFHFHAGMVVRNLLRDILRDEDLPAVKDPYAPRRTLLQILRLRAPRSRNWDDFYLGALNELVEMEICRNATG